MFYSQVEMEDQHPCFGRQLPCFIFHYVLLNWEEEAELFQKFPSHMLSYFLQWPLSLTFLDNIERLWNLVGNYVLEYMFFLFSEPETNSLFSVPSFKSTTGIYSSEHLVRIWVALWNIGLDSSKSQFLDSYVITSIQYRSGQDEFIENFETSGL
ncbi:hypothetical protein AVEN_67373-1 [Araneus ventricosus]|uniref:Uncharacterized protein n=1 Tax=Araneus ventricosus TaxID=182803 RepID=A0A4Y2WV47_ARAVE|nr:hypothetical protein AVEN_67373-1 [Araneus ventricosus]